MIERQSNQGGADWLRERAGHATASCFADILAVGRNGQPLKAREDYLMHLVVERITGEPIVTPSSFAMQWGTEAEPYARATYEEETGAIVREVGFKKHPKHEWVGASSDGLVGPKGGIEIKSPYNSAIHLLTWETGMPEHHKPQVQGQIWVLELDWVDFCSFDPRMQAGAEHLKLYRQRIYRDDAYISKTLEPGVLAFLAEVQAKVDLLNSMEVAA
ncbi:YqaJ-like recombinase protein [Pseudoduganella flava]|uniref:Exonuclease n=1 Tax=Pseudoduganella flava TaxID=871742 RepID=A0A562PHF2_9BURK|nr:lambda exonuclease family protein [Pseudoduganella flava]QGZ42688.1 exonuclease [Pseudoduganella flava]TWI43854.1 YqaJ-like recombinase protein [Pseudoduganella flava]